MSDLDVDEPTVGEGDEPGGGYVELFVGLESPAGQGDQRDADGLPLHYCEFTWLDPQQLLAIATDLAAADERGENVRGVLQSWRRAYLEGMVE